MPLSYAEITSNGQSSQSLSFSFDYLNQSDISVYVDGVLKSRPSEWDFTTTTTISFVSHPASGAVIRIERNTPATTRNVDFQDGSVLSEADLDDSADQIFFIAQEASDTADSAITVSPDGKWDAQNRVIKNVADPVNNNDAVNKQFISTNIPNITTVAGIATEVTNVAGQETEIDVLVNKYDGSTTATSGTNKNIAQVDTVADSINNVNTVANRDADIGTVANRDAQIVTVAARDANIGTVAARDTAIGIVAARDADIGTVAARDTDIGTVAGIDTEVGQVAAKASFITADFVSDLNTLAVTDVVNDINTLATSDIVADLNTLATTDIVSDLNTLATTDIVNDINLLATSDVVSDLNQLATSDFVSDLNTMATTANINNLNTVAGDSNAINTVATNIADVNSFADTYFISATAPASPTTGDLWFDTSSNTMKVYGGSGFQNAGSSVNGTAQRSTFTATAGQTTFAATYDAGYVDVYLNGVKLIAGTDFTATNGTSIVLASGAAANDTVDIVAYGTFQLSNFSINDANDVNAASASTGQFLKWDGTNWVGGTVSTPTLTSLGLDNHDEVEVDAAGQVGINMPTGQNPESNLHVIGDNAGLVASDIARFEGNNDGGNRGLRISQVASGGNQAAIDLQGYHSQSDSNVWNIHMNSAGGNVAIGQSNPHTVPETLTLGSNKNIRLLGTDARIQFLNNGGAYTLNVSGGAAIRFRNQGAGEEIGFETHHGGVQHSEAMNINTKGLVTMNKQPLFGVTGPPSNNTYNTSPISNYLTAVRYNRGGHYHTSGANAGKFIAPVAATYLFEWGMFINSANTFRVQLVVNGGAVTNPYISGHNAGMGSGHPMPVGHQILQLAAGDSVQIGINGSAYLYGGHTGFAGYLLG